MKEKVSYDDIARRYSCAPRRSRSHHGLRIIVSTKRNYRRRLLGLNAEQLYEAAAFRDEARRKRMKAGTAGLAQGHHPRMRDVCELINKAWTDVSSDTIARRFLAPTRRN